jgi:hypothetical protein
MYTFLQLKPLGFFTIVVAASCSPHGGRGGSCADVATIVKKQGTILSEANRLRKMGEIATQTPSAFIETVNWKSENEDLRENPAFTKGRCNAYIAIDGNKNTDEVRVWTARHCINHSIVKSIDIMLPLRDGYAKAEASSIDLERENMLRLATRHFPDNFRKEFLSSEHTSLKQADLDGSACRKETNKKKNSIKEIYSDLSSFLIPCFGTNDLVSFNVVLKKNDPLVQEAILNLEKSFESESKKSIIISTREKLVKEENSKSVFMARNRIAGQMLSLLKCLTETKVCATENSNFSKAHIQTAIESISKNVVSLFPEFKQADESSTEKFIAEKLQSKEVLENIISESNEKVTESRKAIWDIISENSLQNMNLVFHSNTRTDTNKPFSPQSLPMFHRVQDSGKPIKSGVGIGMEIIKDKQVVLFVLDKTKAPFIIESGDSGGVLSISTLPFFVLSTLNGKDTEGIGVEPLPSPKPREKKSLPNETVSGAPKQTVPKIESVPTTENTISTPTKIDSGKPAVAPASKNPVAKAPQETASLPNQGSPENYEGPNPETANYDVDDVVIANRTSLGGPCTP